MMFIYGDNYSVPFMLSGPSSYLGAGIPPCLSGGYPHSSIPQFLIPHFLNSPIPHSSIPQFLIPQFPNSSFLNSSFLIPHIQFICRVTILHPQKQEHKIVKEMKRSDGLRCFFSELVFSPAVDLKTRLPPKICIKILFIGERRKPIAQALHKRSLDFQVRFSAHFSSSIWQYHGITILWYWYW